MTGAVEELEAKVGSMEVVVANVATQLYELKAALDSAVMNSNMTAIASISERVGKMYDALKAAGTATDITPETPVDQPPPVTPPTEPTPPTETPI